MWFINKRLVLHLVFCPFEAYRDERVEQHNHSLVRARSDTRFSRESRCSRLGTVHLEPLEIFQVGVRKQDRGYNMGCLSILHCLIKITKDSLDFTLKCVPSQEEENVWSKARDSCPTSKKWIFSSKMPFFTRVSSHWTCTASFGETMTVGRALFFVVIAIPFRSIAPAIFSTVLPSLRISVHNRLLVASSDSSSESLRKWRFRATDWREAISSFSDSSSYSDWLLKTGDRVTRRAGSFLSSKAAFELPPLRTCAPPTEERFHFPVHCFSALLPLRNHFGMQKIV